MCSLGRSHLKELLHKVRISQVLTPRERNEDGPEFIPKLPVRSRRRAYLCVTFLGDKESGKLAERWFVEGIWYISFSKASLTIRSTEKGYGRSNESHMRLHHKRTTRLVRVIGYAFCSSLSSSDRIRSSISLFKRTTILLSQ